MPNLTEEDVRKIVREEINKDSLLGRDKYVFERIIQILDGRNIQLGKTTGTKIGTETSQKVGFLGKSPVSQQTTISDPSGGGDPGVDSPARTAINALIDALQAFGFIA